MSKVIERGVQARRRDFKLDQDAGVPLAVLALPDGRIKGPTFTCFKLDLDAGVPLVVLALPDGRIKGPTFTCFKCRNPFSLFALHTSHNGRFIAISCQPLCSSLDKRPAMAIAQLHTKCLSHVGHQPRHQC